MKFKILSTDYKIILVISSQEDCHYLKILIWRINLEKENLPISQYKKLSLTLFKDIKLKKDCKFFLTHNLNKGHEDPPWLCHKKSLNSMQ